MSKRIETWDAIAAEAKRSPRWCRYMATLADDPLPAYRLGGIVCADREELSAWLSRPHASGHRNRGTRRRHPPRVPNANAIAIAAKAERRRAANATPSETPQARNARRIAEVNAAIARAAAAPTEGAR